MKKVNLLSYFYPSLCLHCNCFIERGGTLFCSECSLFFEFLPPIENPFFASFEYYGAVSTFIKALKSKKNPYLAKTAASLLFIQFIQSERAFPDYVIPVPCRSFFVRLDHVDQMAQYFSQLSGIKKIQPIKRVTKRPRQTTLSQEQRKTLSAKDFKIKNKELILDKKILLIDDVMTTKSTLTALSDLLLAGGAQEVSAIVLAERNMVF